ncbi:hypothetical protein RchiOBHm_Chr2g0164071 [Rosa chinensis]|uniref:Uncharacterized protein n=1 Tax=Rosa chinensis TaxID=74649 RepID=A0A2P6S3G0_ROSCH|nr:hypothetical protein RchiOBHm_Chr2g0164071 [Rosa chinensis]
MEVWIAVKGLRMAMRNDHSLTLLGNALTLFVRYDQGALQRKDPVQRILIVHDVRR